MPGEVAPGTHAEATESPAAGASAGREQQAAAKQSSAAASAANNGAVLSPPANGVEAASNQAIASEPPAVAPAAVALPAKLPGPQASSNEKPAPNESSAQAAVAVNSAVPVSDTDAATADKEATDKEATDGARRTLEALAEICRQRGTLAVPGGLMSHTLRGTDPPAGQPAVPHQPTADRAHGAGGAAAVAPAEQPPNGQQVALPAAGGAQSDMAHVPAAENGSMRQQHQQQPRGPGAEGAQLDAIVKAMQHGAAVATEAATLIAADAPCKHANAVDGLPEPSHPRDPERTTPDTPQGNPDSAPAPVGASAVSEQDHGEAASLIGDPDVALEETVAADDGPASGPAATSAAVQMAAVRAAATQPLAETAAALEGDTPPAAAGEGMAPGTAAWPCVVVGKDPTNAVVAGVAEPAASQSTQPTTPSSPSEDMAPLTAVIKQSQSTELVGNASGGGQQAGVHTAQPVNTVSADAGTVLGAQPETPEPEGAVNASASTKAKRATLRDLPCRRSASGLPWQIATSERESNEGSADDDADTERSDDDVTSADLKEVEHVAAARKEMKRQQQRRSGGQGTVDDGGGGERGPEDTAASTKVSTKATARPSAPVVGPTSSRKEGSHSHGETAAASGGQKLFCYLCRRPCARAITLNGVKVPACSKQSECWLALRRVVGTRKEWPYASTIEAIKGQVLQGVPLVQVGRQRFSILAPRDDFAAAPAATPASRHASLAEQANAVAAAAVAADLQQLGAAMAGTAAVVVADHGAAIEPPLTRIVGVPSPVKLNGSSGAETRQSAGTASDAAAGGRTDGGFNDQGGAKVMQLLVYQTSPEHAHGQYVVQCADGSLATHGLDALRKNLGCKRFNKLVSARRRISNGPLAEDEESAIAAVIAAHTLPGRDVHGRFLPGTNGQSYKRQASSLEAPASGSGAFVSRAAGANSAARSSGGAPPPKRARDTRTARASSAQAPEPAQEDDAMMLDYDLRIERPRGPVDAGAVAGATVANAGAGAGAGTGAVERAAPASVIVPPAAATHAAAQPSRTPAARSANAACQCGSGAGLPMEGATDNGAASRVSLHTAANIMLDKLSFALSVLPCFAQARLPLAALDRVAKQFPEYEGVQRVRSHLEHVLDFVGFCADEGGVTFMPQLVTVLRGMVPLIQQLCTDQEVPA